MTPQELDTPTVVTVSSLSGTGPGYITTPAGQPDVLIKVLTPFKVISVRALKVFLETFLATLGVGATNVIPVEGVSAHVMVAVSVAGVAAGINVIRNLIELLGKFDQSHPTLTA